MSETSKIIDAVSPGGMCNSEGGAAAVPATPVAALLAGHVLRDGELVLLLLRPSRWFILLTSLRAVTAVAILMIVAMIFDERIHHTSRQWLEAGIFLIAGRLMWAILQWMGRLYILTDLRIIRVSGVLNVQVFDCPLRKVARTLLEIPFKERLFRIGSIVIIPQDETLPIATWRMIPRPRQTHEMIIATINKAKHNGSGCRT